MDVFMLAVTLVVGACVGGIIGASVCTWVQDRMEARREMKTVVLHDCALVEAEETKDDFDATGPTWWQVAVFAAVALGICAVVFAAIW